MKIVHVVDSMEVGGAEMLVAQMCRLQREQGHEPQVYAVAKLGALGKRMREEGFQVEAEVGRHLLDASAGFLKLFRRFRPEVGSSAQPYADDLRCSGGKAGRRGECDFDAAQPGGTAAQPHDGAQVRVGGAVLRLGCGYLRRDGEQREAGRKRTGEQDCSDL